MFNNPWYVAAIGIIVPWLTLFLKKKIADAKERSRREHEAPMDNIKNVAETIKIWKDITDYKDRELLACRHRTEYFETRNTELEVKITELETKIYDLENPEES